MARQISKGTCTFCHGEFSKSAMSRHLSAFEIEGARYAIDAGMYNDWDMSEKSMRVRLDKVLSPGQSCSYEYDYGTTTELKLKVISERQVAVKGNAIQILARNIPPLIHRLCLASRVLDPAFLIQPVKRIPIKPLPGAIRIVQGEL